MYLGVDIGGTKTLVALFDRRGELKASKRFPTPAVYEDFLVQLGTSAKELSSEPFDAACVALPGLVDSKGRVGVALGNLPWLNIPIVSDCKKLFNCPVVVENDAKLAGLSEAKHIKKDFKKVLYITISTGIGYSLITKGIIDQNIADGGGRTILVERKGAMVPWESFASGKAITQRFGKRASEIDDPIVWKEMARDFAVGIIDLIAITQPDVVVIGGGVGTHFNKFAAPLREILKSYETPLMPIPPIRRAEHPEEAVIYGCYELLKDVHGHLIKKS